MADKNTRKSKSQSSRRTKSSTSARRLAGFLVLLIILLIACISCLGQRLFPNLFPPTVTPAAVTSAPVTITPTGAKPEVQPPAEIPMFGSGGRNWYQVFFTNPVYPDDENNRKSSLDESLTAFINSAQESVDMAIYQLDLENVIQALISAKKRGVTVRIVTDLDTYEDHRENASYKLLEKAGIPVVAGNNSGIMHNKFVVVDGKEVWTGSWNFTEYDTHRYNNHGIWIASRELAWNYTVTFEKMFKDKQFGGNRDPGGITHKLTIAGHPVENYFSPEDEVMDAITTQLRNAKKSVNFMTFSFTEDAMGDILKRLSKTGVEIHGVFENTGSETEYSEYGRLRRARPPVDVLQDGNPYLMHHKVFIIDGKTVILGSFNFSNNAQTSNDENLLIIEDQSLAAEFQKEFERIYKQAQEKAREE